MCRCDEWQQVLAVCEVWSDITASDLEAQLPLHKHIYTRKSGSTRRASYTQGQPESLALVPYTLTFSGGFYFTKSGSAKILQFNFHDYMHASFKPNFHGFYFRKCRLVCKVCKKLSIAKISTCTVVIAVTSLFDDRSAIASEDPIVLHCTCPIQNLVLTYITFWW